jgi:hypothetical protein
MWMRLSIVLLGMGIAFGAAAQGAKKGENGGEVVVMEGHPIEFVAKGQSITFYILEDDAKSPTPAQGFSGRAVIQDGGKTVAVALSPAEPNKFVGQLSMRSAPKRGWSFRRKCQATPSKRDSPQSRRIRMHFREATCHQTGLAPLSWRGEVLGSGYLV